MLSFVLLKTGLYQIVIMAESVLHIKLHQMYVFVSFVLHVKFNLLALSEFMSQIATLAVSI